MDTDLYILYYVEDLPGVIRPFAFRGFPIGNG